MQLQLLLIVRPDCAYGCHLALLTTIRDIDQTLCDGFLLDWLHRGVAAGAHYDCL